MPDYIIKEYCRCEYGMVVDGPWPSAKWEECQECNGKGIFIYEDHAHDIEDAASNYPKAFMIEEIDK